MSKENLEKFTQQVQQDPSQQQKLAAAPSKEQASAQPADYSGELDESELDAVAGGRRMLGSRGRVGGWW